jgi:hypothetical protein
MTMMPSTLFAVTLSLIHYESIMYALLCASAVSAAYFSNPAGGAAPHHESTQLNVLILFQCF